MSGIEMKSEEQESPEEVSGVDVFEDEENASEIPAMDIEETEEICEPIVEVIEELQDEEVQEEEFEYKKTREKVGIFPRNWVEVKSVSPSGSEKIFTSVHAGTIIYDQDEIERLVSIGAPLKVYIEHGSN